MHIGQAAQGAALRIGKPTLPALIYKMYLAHGVFTLGSCPCNRICIAGIKNGGLCNKSEVGRRTLKHAANRLSVGCGNRCIFNSIRAAYIRISRSATYLVCALGFHISACRQLIGQLFALQYRTLRSRLSYRPSAEAGFALNPVLLTCEPSSIIGKSVQLSEFLPPGSPTFQCRDSARRQADPFPWRTGCLAS